MSKERVTFTELVAAQAEKMELYTVAITRAHGESHPEAFTVRELYEKITEKLAADKDKARLESEFSALREVTNDYTVPGDVCPTYVDVYQTLAAMDQAYEIETNERGNK